MIKRWGLHRQSLTLQMVLSFITLVLLTTVAAAIPAVWLIRQQIERQAWAQVGQAERATQALYANVSDNLENLAALASQRPTLHHLLEQGNQEDLDTYLHTLQQDTVLDLLVVCSPDGEMLAQTGTVTSSNLCTTLKQATFYELEEANKSTIWLLTGHDIQTSENGSQGRVIAGFTLNTAFMRKLQEETGLIHSLYADNTLFASSTGDVSGWVVSSYEAVNLLPSENGQFVQFDVAGLPYYATRLQLQDTKSGYPKFADEVALPVTDIATVQRNLLWLLISSLTAIVLIGSVVGILLARRIGRPLTQLVAAAETMSTSDLSHPVTVQSGVYEVSLVADALEKARIDLEHTINDLGEAKTWIEHLLAAIVEGIVTLDTNNSITFLSPGAERICGFSQEQVLGQHCDKVFPLADDGLFSQKLPLPGKQSKVNLRTTNNHSLVLAITGARSTAPTVADAETILVLRDVTETEAIHRLLGGFLANITHEFRTPLSALAASAELLHDQAEALTVAERQELLASLHLGILSLQTLIDNLLESASLEAGHFRIYPRLTDLGEMIGEAVRIMKPLQEKYEHYLTIELPVDIPEVMADHRRIVQVLVNLISNAIKYSPSPSTIYLQVTHQPGEVQIMVADEGAGIPAFYKDDLFRPFILPPQVNNHTQMGAGLGLSVVKAIVEAHKGEVGVYNGENGGAVFWFTLPLPDEEMAL